ncbi:hypothetical protein [Methylorubrum zatmanii]|uniref:Uncharacterized protein n=1 Tax=Methylorubrum zatmanii TaxID=29429 RepID=A0ABW1WMF9_9HYPH|nr:hypothetical protein [Methylorubrum zatmanii]MBD8909242.1 hypothetical protein [Methylorubrum zatmanii]
MRIPSTRHTGLALLLALCASSGATADPLLYGYSEVRFAQPAIDGTYLGAPFAPLPSTSRIVPPAWGYGTYGIPTVAGIREAPTARPTLTVIERRGSAAGRSAPRRRGARVLSKDSGGAWIDPAPRSETEGGPRVVSVQVPARIR